MEEANKILKTLEKNLPEDNEEMVFALSQIKKQFETAKEKMQENLNSFNDEEKIEKQQEELDTLNFLILQIKKMISIYSPDYHYLNEDFTGTQPDYLLIQGKKIKGRYWTDILTETFRYFKELDETKFESLVVRKNIPVYYSKRRMNVNTPVEVFKLKSGKEGYLKKYANTQRIIRAIKNIAQEYDIPFKEIKILLK